MFIEVLTVIALVLAIIVCLIAIFIFVYEMICMLVSNIRRKKLYKEEEQRLKGIPAFYANVPIMNPLCHKSNNVKKTYSGKPRSGKSILIAKERALFEKLQNSNSKEDEKR